MDIILAFEASVGGSNPSESISEQRDSNGSAGRGRGDLREANRIPPRARPHSSIGRAAPS